MWSYVLVFAGLVVGMMVGFNKTMTKQLRSAQRACQCECAPIYGYWPWIQQDIGGVLQSGETVKRHPFGISGVLVCLASDELDPGTRFDHIQRAMDERTELRLAAQGRDDP